MMVRTRRSSGLRPLGSLSPDRLGLPGAKGRELALDHAWRSVAGLPIWRRTCRIALRRGVLDLTIDDKVWARTLNDLAPELVARLAADRPELGIRRFRVRFEGENGPPQASIPLPAPEELPIEKARANHAPSSARPAPTAGPGPSPREPGVDPRAVMERYLKRVAARRSQKP